MPPRQYYSIRTGKSAGSVQLSLAALKRLFLAQYDELDTEGYFQEHLGLHCVDSDFTPGTLGRDVDGAVLLALRKDHLWPVRGRIEHYSEDDLFDVVEFLHDHASKPTKREMHSWNDCGWHCYEFDGELGRAEFRSRVNRILSEYGEGFQLSHDGEVLAVPSRGLEPLLDAQLPASSPAAVHLAVDAATRKFRRHRASDEDRRDALRDLAGVVELLRPELKRVLSSKDENDLFNIANNFGIRHQNQQQKTMYNKTVWYSWIFYFYLATIHAALHLIERSQTARDQPTGLL